MFNNITATTLLNLGYVPVSVIPPGASLARNSTINPKIVGKIPGIKMTDGAWCGYTWRDNAPSSEDAVKWDASGANIGILATNTPAFDIDVDDANISEKIKQEILRVCGSAPVRTGKPPRSLLIYRSDTAIKKQKLDFIYQGKGHTVELLGDGQQFVVSGTHPQRHTYSVSNIIPHNELVCLTPELVRDAFQAMGKLIESGGGTVLKSPEKDDAANDRTEGETASCNKVDLTGTEIRGTVNELDPDMSYSNWITVGMGLHAQYDGGDEGLSIWTQWSEGGKKFKRGECERKWKTFKLNDGGISFATVIKMASDCPQHEEATSSRADRKSSMHPLPMKPKSGTDLMQREFQPLNWVVEGILPEGCYLLAGDPKKGKSWWALELSMAVTTGAKLFGKDVKQGGVLYLALEDTERRLQDRIRKLSSMVSFDPKNFYYEVVWAQDGQGGVEALEHYLQNHPDIKLVVIDTFEKIRMPAARGANIYSEDYRAVQSFKKLSDKFRVTILFVHHLKKNKSADVSQNVSGSMGLTAAVDGTLTLTRLNNDKQATLDLSGRDIADESTLHIRFDDGFWSQGEPEIKQQVLSENKQKVMDALKALGGMGTPTDIVRVSGIISATARELLGRMVSEGLLTKPSRGVYMLPSDGQNYKDPLDIDDVPISTIQQLQHSNVDVSPTYANQQPQHISEDIYDDELNVDVVGDEDMEGLANPEGYDPAADMRHRLDKAIAASLGGIQSLQSNTGGQPQV